jgi:hypothetical protein
MRALAIMAERGSGSLLSSALSRLLHHCLEGYAGLLTRSQWFRFVPRIDFHIVH